MSKPDKGQYLEVNGIKTFFIKEGNGDPLVLVHGGSPGACTLFNWGMKNIESLAASGFTVYAFDQPGFGYTDNPTDYSIEYRVAHAKSFIDGLKLDRFHLIGNSQGAYIAARIALEDRRVGRLVFVSSGSLSPRGSAKSDALGKEHSEELRQYNPSLENARSMTMKTFFNKELVTEEFVQLRYEMSTGKNLKAFLKRKEVPRPRPIHEDLRNLEVRTLILWGNNDRGVTAERGLLLFQLLPDAELHFFGRCGHLVQHDQGARFRSIVVNFLKADTG